MSCDTGALGENSLFLPQDTTRSRSRSFAAELNWCELLYQELLILGKELQIHDDAGTMSRYTSLIKTSLTKVSVISRGSRIPVINFEILDPLFAIAEGEETSHTMTARVFSCFLALLRMCSSDITISNLSDIIESVSRSRWELTDAADHESTVANGIEVLRECVRHRAYIKLDNAVHVNLLAYSLFMAIQMESSNLLRNAGMQTILTICEVGFINAASADDADKICTVIKQISVWISCRNAQDVQSQLLNVSDTPYHCTPDDAASLRVQLIGLHAAHRLVFSIPHSLFCVPNIEHALFYNVGRMVLEVVSNVKLGEQSRQLARHVVHTLFRINPVKAAPLTLSVAGLLLFPSCRSSNSAFNVSRCLADVSSEAMCSPPMDDTLQWMCQLCSDPRFVLHSCSEYDLHRFKPDVFATVCRHILFMLSSSQPVKEKELAMQAIVNILTSLATVLYKNTTIECSPHVLDIYEQAALRKTKVQSFLETFSESPLDAVSLLGTIFSFTSDELQIEGFQVGKQFYLLRHSLDKTKLGCFLTDIGSKSDSVIRSAVKDHVEFHRTLLQGFIESHDFEGKALITSLRETLAGFHMPGEAQKIDRVIETFSQSWYSLNHTNAAVNPFPSVELAFLYTFSCVILATNLHNPSVSSREKMSEETFTQMISGANGAESIPQDYIATTFRDISHMPLSLRDPIYEIQVDKNWYEMILEQHTKSLWDETSPGRAIIDSTLETPSTLVDAALLAFLVAKDHILTALSAGLATEYENKINLQQTSPSDCGGILCPKVPVRLDAEIVLHQLMSVEALLPLDHVSIIGESYRWLALLANRLQDTEFMNKILLSLFPYTMDYSLTRIDVSSARPDSAVKNLSVSVILNIVHLYSSHIRETWPDVFGLMTRLFLLGMWPDQKVKSLGAGQGGGAHTLASMNFIMDTMRSNTFSFIFFSYMPSNGVRRESHEGQTKNSENDGWFGPLAKGSEQGVSTEESSTRSNDDRSLLQGYSIPQFFCTWAIALSDTDLNCLAQHMLSQLPTTWECLPLEITIAESICFHLHSVSLLAEYAFHRLPSLLDLVASRLLNMLSLLSYAAEESCKEKEEPAGLVPLSCEILGIQTTIALLHFCTIRPYSSIWYDVFDAMSALNVHVWRKCISVPLCGWLSGTHLNNTSFVTPQSRRDRAFLRCAQIAILHCEHRAAREELWKWMCHFLEKNELSHHIGDILPEIISLIDLSSTTQQLTSFSQSGPKHVASNAAYINTELDVQHPLKKIKCNEEAQLNSKDSIDITAILSELLIFLKKLTSAAGSDSMSWKNSWSSVTKCLVILPSLRGGDYWVTTKAVLHTFVEFESLETINVSPDIISEVFGITVDFVQEIFTEKRVIGVSECSTEDIEKGYRSADQTQGGFSYIFSRLLWSPSTAESSATGAPQLVESLPSPSRIEAARVGMSLITKLFVKWVYQLSQAQVGLFKRWKSVLELLNDAFVNSKTGLSEALRAEALECYKTLLWSLQLSTSLNHKIKDLEKNSEFWTQTKLWLIAESRMPILEDSIFNINSMSVP